MILLTVLMTTGIAYVVIERLEPQYRARSTLVLTVLDTRVRTTDVELESFEMTRAIIETEIDILHSRGFAAEVAENLSLFRNPEFGGVVDDGTDTGVDPETRDRVIDATLAAYTAFRSGESLAIAILATAPDPDLAAGIANTVTETYISNAQDKRREGIEQGIQFLRSRVAGLGEELSQAEVSLASFIRNNDLDDTELPGQLRAEENRLNAMIASLEADRSSEARSRSQEIAAQVEEVGAKLQALTRSQLTLLRMERSMELLRARYQSAVERLNGLETQQNFSGQGARQVTVARVPSEPFWPDRRMLLAAGAFAGLVLAVVAALLREATDTRISSETGVAGISGVMNFGYVPRLVSKGLFRRRHAPLRALRDDPNSAFAQSLSRLLTLWLNLRAGSKVLMITSGLPAEGKSTLAVSLGAIAARSGMKVLLVDLDRHRRGVSNLLEATIDPVGPAALLEGRASPIPVSVDGDQVEGLEVLSLDLQNRAAAQSMSDMLHALKQHLTERYDIVLLDTPPVLAVDDACRLRGLAENTLVAVRWNRTTRDELRGAMQQLGRNGIAVTGTVITDLNTRKHRRYGYGGFVQYHAYGPSHQR